MKKYELTEEMIEWFGRTLYRIRACKDFETINGTMVQKGDLGGFIEKEDNLSQEGRSWVGDNAKVCGNAEVYGCTEVCSYAYREHVKMRNFLHYVFAGGSFTLYTAALGNTGSFSAGTIDWYIYLIMMVVCVTGGTLCAKLSIKFAENKKISHSAATDERKIIKTLQTNNIAPNNENVNIEVKNVHMQ